MLNAEDGDGLTKRIRSSMKRKLVGIKLKLSIRCMKLFFQSITLRQYVKLQYVISAANIRIHRNNLYGKFDII